MEQLLLQIEKTTGLIKSLTEQLEMAKEEDTKLRDELKLQFKAIGEKSLRTPNNRYRASISVRKDVKVADELMVRAYLQSNGLLEECLRLDQQKVKGYAKIREIPGMEETETEILTISEIKEKVEPITSDESDKEFIERVRNTKS